MSDDSKKKSWIAVLVSVIVVGAITGFFFARRRKCGKGGCSSKDA